jgi:hypothetical protein
MRRARNRSKRRDAAKQLAVSKKHTQETPGGSAPATLAADQEKNSKRETQEFGVFIAVRGTTNQLLTTLRNHGSIAVSESS